MSSVPHRQQFSELQFPGHVDSWGSWPLELDEMWDALLPDEDQLDPQPEPGDFWIEDL